jgi:hypothetical protein
MNLLLFFPWPTLRSVLFRSFSSFPLRFFSLSIVRLTFHHQHRQAPLVAVISFFSHIYIIFFCDSNLSERFFLLTEKGKKHDDEENFSFVSKYYFLLYSNIYFQLSITDVHNTLIPLLQSAIYFRHLVVDTPVS